MGTEVMPVHNPYTGEIIDKVPAASVELAQECAKNAACFRSPLSSWERFEVLQCSAREVLGRKDELSRLISREAGVALCSSRREIDRAYQALLFSAEEAKRLQGETLPADVVPGIPHKFAATWREPVGLVVAITPFNHPLNQVVHKVGPALAANNTVVLKPSEKTPLTALRFAKILLDNGLPAPMLSVLTGEADQIGPALVSHPEVDLVSFTGSVEVGEEITRIAGVKKLCLELGGNDPLIVLEDADLDLAVRIAVDGAFSNSGQRCTSIKRLLVHEAVAEKFVEEFTEATQRLRFGDPLDPCSEVGCLIDEPAAIRVESRIKTAVRDGAVLCCGGKRVGALIEPAVLDRMSPCSELVVLETFGPTAPIIRIRGESEAIAIANSTPFGLQAGIVTRDLNRALQMGRQLKVGAVMVNEGPGFRVESLPFGGVKKSGFGKEGIRYAIEAMTNLKLIVM